MATEIKEVVTQGFLDEKQLKNKIVEYYIDKNLTVKEAGKALGLSYESIKYYLNKFRILKDKAKIQTSFNKYTGVNVNNGQSYRPNQKIIEKYKNIDVNSVPDEVIYVDKVRNSSKLDKETNKQIIIDRIRRILRRRRGEE